jgi:hypothetical protein
MQLRLEFQLNPVADPVSALIGVVRPILLGTLFALKRDVVDEVGGFENVKLKMLPRLYRKGDGDCGICFEYAVHDAVTRADEMVIDRVSDALGTYCRVPGDDLGSILFGAEKAGSQQLIDTAVSQLTDESRVLSGTRGRPVKLRNHLTSIATAFRRPEARKALPQSIRGLWKADLFLGHSDSDRWVGTSVKINRDHLEPARGLRIGIVPSREGESEASSVRATSSFVRWPTTGASWRCSTGAGSSCSNFSLPTRRSRRNPHCHRRPTGKSPSSCTSVATFSLSRSSTPSNPLHNQSFSERTNGMRRSS